MCILYLFIVCCAESAWVCRLRRVARWQGRGLGHNSRSILCVIYLVRCAMLWCTPDPSIYTHNAKQRQRREGHDKRVYSHTFFNPPYLRYIYNTQTESVYFFFCSVYRDVFFFVAILNIIIYILTKISIFIIICLYIISWREVMYMRAYSTSKRERERAAWHWIQTCKPLSLFSLKVTKINSPHHFPLHSFPS